MDQVAVPLAHSPSPALVGIPTPGYARLNRAAVVVSVTEEAPRLPWIARPLLRDEWCAERLQWCSAGVETVSSQQTRPALKTELPSMHLSHAKTLFSSCVFGLVSSFVQRNTWPIFDIEFL